jgi:hypothetical protein
MIIEIAVIMSDSSDSDCDEQWRLLMLQCATLVTYAGGAAALAYGLPLFDKTPYHTSALSRADWVCELLNGHPECICNELGVHKHIFKGIITALQQAGLHSSKHVYLEERLAIFLYTCVRGLSLNHISKQFQCAGETTCVLCFIQAGL